MIDRQRLRVSAYASYSCSLLFHVFVDLLVSHGTSMEFCISYVPTTCLFRSNSSYLTSYLTKYRPQSLREPWLCGYSCVFLGHSQVLPYSFFMFSFQNRFFLWIENCISFYFTLLMVAILIVIGDRIPSSSGGLQTKDV